MCNGGGGEKVGLSVGNRCALSERRHSQNLQPPQGACLSVAVCLWQEGRVLPEERMDPLA